MMTIGAAVASCDEADLLVPCLSSLAGFDEVVVMDLECSDDTRAVGESHGARVVHHPRPPFVEKVRDRQLLEATTDWVLFVDPDERLPNGWLETARSTLSSLPDEVAGQWIAYQEVAFGRRLQWSRSGAAKAALVKRHAVRARPPATVLPHEMLHFDGELRVVDPALPLIDHHGYTSVRSAIEKATRYASHGGVGAAEVPERPGPLVAIKMLWGSVVMSQAYKDGPAGVAVGSLSSIGDYLGMLVRWEDAGYPNIEEVQPSSPALSLARRAHAAQWSVRRRARRQLGG